MRISVEVIGGADSIGANACWFRMQPRWGRPTADSLRKRAVSKTLRARELSASYHP